LTESEERRLIAQAYGRVQGVGYRAMVISEARRLGLAGWVRNRADGSVEILAEGQESKLTLLLAALRQGPPFARVKTLTETWDNVAGAPMPFQVKPTA
jgi:acylphosphatase